MKGTAQRKAVTSGRLAGATRGSRGAADPRAAPRSKPAYSLYSTDSEDQVTNLHQGLDRCAALLSGMLQADNAASASLVPPRAPAKGAAAKSRRSGLQVKKAVRKPPAKAGGASPRPHGAVLTPPAHSGVKLHPPAVASPPPPVLLLSVRQSSGDEDGDAFPAPAPAQDPRSLRDLLGELKAQIVGRGGAAEQLLARLEGALTSPQGDGTPSLLGENALLRKRVRMLNQQLKERERAEWRRDPEASVTSLVASLQEELDAAQARLRELQGDITELRQAHQDTQGQLKDREAESALLKTELDATRGRLTASEREKGKLASLAQQRLEEIGTLNRLLQSRPTITDGSRDAKSRAEAPPAPPTDHIAHFLTSLSRTQDEPGRPEAPARPDCRAAEPAWSEWSAQSASTFDTRDEEAFRDGLAALDASIASLQRTIQLDLRS